MSFRDDVQKVLEDVVAESNGNQAEAARRMGMKQSTTLHTWIVGARTPISTTLDVALTSVGCRLVRDQRGAVNKPASLQTPPVESAEVVELKAKLKKKEEELAECRMTCKILKELMLEMSGGKRNQPQKQDGQGDAGSSSSA